MYITKLTFDALPFEQQIVIVWDEGHFVARRFEEEDTVGLYRMAGGFFAELYYDELVNEMVQHITTFTDQDSDRLTDYSYYVRLDDLNKGQK